MNVGFVVVDFELADVTTGSSEECCVGVMYVEWRSIYNFVVISKYLWTMLVCMCFMLALIFLSVYGFGIYVDVCGIVCVSECCLFL